MNNKDLISTYYINARELVRQNNPKAARAYILKILNAAVETYNSATTIVSKAKTGAFLDKWIAVSRDLYYYGITDYVRDCFGLAAQVEIPPKSQHKPRPQLNEDKPPQEDNQPTLPKTAGVVDIDGLLDETSKTQGWCADVFEANKGAVVEISVAAVLQGASGTGFIISSNGYLLTNDHVVFDEQNGTYYAKITMSLAGENKKHKLEVLFSDKNTDVALCKFNPDEVQNFSVVNRITDYSALKQGADCLVIGNAFGMGLAPFTGIVRFTKNDYGDLVYTAPSNPGDSGGPVFNRSGQCIGINKSKTLSFNHTAADGYANATPMDAVDKLLTKWTSNNNIEL